MQHVRTIEDLRSTRIGRHRILSRLKGEDELTFVRLIHPKDLEVTLKKVGRGGGRDTIRTSFFDTSMVSDKHQSPSALRVEATALERAPGSVRRIR